MAAGVLMLIVGVAVLSRLFRHDLAGRLATMNLDNKSAGSATAEAAAAASAVGAVGGASAGADLVPGSGAAAGGAVASSAGERAVAAAASQAGVPYSWGGGTTSGPSRGFGRGASTVGFDCSSYVQFAWAKAGVTLPRTTYDQIKVGRPVDPKNEAKWLPGDLLFPHDGHVMLYAGNGKAWQEPQTGGHAELVDVSTRPSYIAVRRPS